MKTKLKTKHKTINHIIKYKWLLFLTITITLFTATNCLDVRGAFVLEKKSDNSDNPNKPDDQNNPMPPPPPPSCLINGKKVLLKDLNNPMPGKGTKDEPYVLCHPNHVKLMGRPPSYALDKYYTIGTSTDIDMQGARLEPLGSPCVTGADASKRFTGYFDGKHRVIKNYELTGGVKVGTGMAAKTYYPEVGFFSCIETGKVKGFANARFEPKKGVCDVLPADYQTNLKKCSASGTVHCSGALGQPTIVCSRDHLEKIGLTAAARDDSYILTDHIDLQQPTAKTYTNYIISDIFTGIFNGNGFEIRNVTAEPRYDFAIFRIIGRSGDSGEIRNLGIRGVKITKSVNSSAVLANTIQDGSIVENVYIIDDDNDIDIENINQGARLSALVNFLSNATVTNSFVRLQIKNSKPLIAEIGDAMGGFLVYLYNGGKIKNSYANVKLMVEGDPQFGSVSSDKATENGNSNFSVGGLVGYAETASSSNPNQILNSFSMGSITNTTGKTGSMTAGGLIGDQPPYKAVNTTIQNSFSVMKLTGRKTTGGSPLERMAGLIGYFRKDANSSSVSIYNSYARGILDYNNEARGAHYGGIAASFSRAKLILKNVYSGTKFMGMLNTNNITGANIDGTILGSVKGGILGYYTRNSSNTFTNVFFDTSSSIYGEGHATAKACGRGKTIDDCPAAGGAFTAPAAATVTGSNGKAALKSAAQTAWATNYPVWKFSGTIASVQGDGYPALDLCAGWDKDLAADATTDTDSIIDNDNDPDEARFDINRNGVKEADECVWDQSVYPPRLKIFPADIQPRSRP